MLDPHEELDRMHERSARVFAEVMSAIQVARLRGDMEQAVKLEARLGRDLGNLMAAADLLGRSRLVRELRDHGIEIEEKQRGEQFAAPKVPFVEAIESILSRFPVLAVGWNEAREAWNARGFALAKSTSVTITAKVQKTFVRSLRGGASEVESVERIHKQLKQGDGSITRAYADTVFRTATSDAYAEGRKAQAQRPGVRRAASGWRYVSTRDSDVRDNHKAGQNFVAHVDDPVWLQHSPPNGFNCRCALEIVPTAEMVELGLSYPDGSLQRTVFAPPGFVADPGFKATA